MFVLYQILFIVIVFFSSLQAMKEKEAVEDGWVKVKVQSEQQLASKIEALQTELDQESHIKHGLELIIKDLVFEKENLKKQLEDSNKANKSALKYLTEHGGSPKLIKLLTNPNNDFSLNTFCLENLKKSRNNLITNNGGQYALENAIKIGDLGFIKKYFPDLTPDNKFFAFKLATKLRSKKIAQWIASNLVLDKDRLNLLYTFISKHIRQHCLPTLQLVFSNNLSLSKKKYKQLLTHALEESSNYGFTEGTHYLLDLQKLGCYMPISKTI